MTGTALEQVATTLATPQMQQQFGALLPKEVPLDRFTEVTMMAIRQNPKLLEADRQTLYDACLTIARRGLLPDKEEAALVIFPTNVGTYDKPIWKQQVVAQPMVKGIIKEMGKKDVHAYAVSVYANDKVRVWNDDNGQHVEHEPVTFGVRGERVGAFAAGKLPNGRTYVEPMNMEELEKVALRSKQAVKDGGGGKKRGGTWASDPERMEQKTCLHRLRKRIPILDSQPGDDGGEFDPEPIAPAAQEPQGSPAPQLEARVQGDAPKAEKRRPRTLQAVVDQVREPEPPQDPDPPAEVRDDYQPGDIL